MTNEELQLLIKDVSLKWFNRSFEHQAIWCSRLQTTGGRYHLQTHHLDFNPRVLSELGIDALIGVIKHELCHYHLHLCGLGYWHQDKDFKMLLQQVNGRRYVSWDKVMCAKHIYQCTGCRQKIYRQRQFNALRYVCRRCRCRYQKVEK